MLSGRAANQIFNNLNANIFETIQPHGPNHIRPKENSFAWSIPMDRDLCIVCQKVSSEKLRCPAKSNQAPADVYSAFLDNVKNSKI